MPSPYLYTCLSVLPTFEIYRKKWIPDRRLSARNNWNRCDFVIDIRASGRSIGLLSFKHLRLAFWKWYVRFACTWGWEKKSSFGRCLREALSLFPEREGLLFYLLSFCKNEYHPFPAPPILLPKCTRIRVNIFSSFLVCVPNLRK